MPKAVCIEMLAIAGSDVIYNRGETYEDVPAAILKDHADHFSKVAKAASTKDASKASEDK
jgi:hypothetical protein